VSQPGFLMACLSDQIVAAAAAHACRRQRAVSDTSAEVLPRCRTLSEELVASVSARKNRLRPQVFDLALQDSDDDAQMSMSPETPSCSQLTTPTRRRAQSIDVAGEKFREQSVTDYCQDSIGCNRNFNYAHELCEDALTKEKQERQAEASANCEDEHKEKQILKVHTSPLARLPLGWPAIVLLLAVLAAILAMIFLLQPYLHSGSQFLAIVQDGSSQALTPSRHAWKALHIVGLLRPSG